MKYEFQKYERRGERMSSPAVTVTRRCLIFNVASAEKYLKDSEHVELYFDNTNMAVGILPLKEETKDSFPIKKYRRKSPVTIVNASRFISHFGIMDILEKRKSFMVKEGEKGMLMLRLLQE